MNKDTQPGKGRKGLKILLIIACILMLIGIGLGVLLWWEATRYERESKISDYFIVAPELNVVEKKANGFNPVETFPFGTILSLQRKGTRNNGKSYHRIIASSTEVDKYKENEYYIESVDDYDIKETYHREQFLKMFPQKEAQMLPTHVKKILMDNPHADYHEYGFTQDFNRIKSSIVGADFNMDGEDDVAVILEGQYQTNRIYVLCYNKDLDQSYIAYTDYNGGFASLRLFNKDALIFMDSEKLVKAPNNGLIYESTQKGHYKYAILYNPKTMQFAQYIQKPLSEIRASYEEVHEEEYDVVEAVEIEPEPEEVVVSSDDESEGA